MKRLLRDRIFFSSVELFTQSASRPYSGSWVLTSVTARNSGMPQEPCITTTVNQQNLGSRQRQLTLILNHSVDSKPRVSQGILYRLIYYEKYQNWEIEILGSNHHQHLMEMWCTHFVESASFSKFPRAISMRMRSISHFNHAGFQSSPLLVWLLCSF